MKNTFKTLLAVFTAPCLLMYCLHVNVLKSSSNSRKPAIEVTKEYHFNKSLLAQLKR
jgi:hypothetical protein